MQDFLIALLIGFLLGWLLEWLIDWQYWRSTARALRQENEQLRRQLAGEQVADDTQSSGSLTASSPPQTDDKDA